MKIQEFVKTNTLQSASEQVVHQPVSSFWKKCENKYVCEYVENGEISIRRRQLFDEKDITKKIIGILLWGYPNGMRGKNLSNIYKSIETIKRYVIKYRYDGEKLFEKLSGIKGLGLSTITKILYFFQIKCGNQYIPILDSHVINSMDFFEDFDGVHQNNRGWIFIKETAAIFNGVDGIKYDDLEYYLFELDKKWEKHIKEFKREQLETLTRELIP